MMYIIKLSGFGYQSHGQVLTGSWENETGPNPGLLQNPATELLNYPENLDPSLLIR
jgi:hypothetical protein